MLYITEHTMLPMGVSIPWQAVQVTVMHITWKVHRFLRLFTSNGRKSGPHQECSKTIGKTCISASAKNPNTLEILWLGGNPYKTIGNQWLPAAGNRDGNWPPVCAKQVTRGAPLGKRWFSLVFLKVPSAMPLWSPLGPCWRLQNLMGS